MNKVLDFVLRSRILRCFPLTVLFVLSLDAKRFRVPEPALEQALAKTLGVQREDLTEELVAEKLISLDVSDKRLRDLTGLEVARNLQILVLRDNLIEDITPLSGLGNLSRLDLSGNRIRNLAPLESLSLYKMKMEVLRLQVALENRNLPKDKKAELILELSKVVQRINRGHWSIRELSLANNRLLGLSGIGHLTSLRYLDVSANSLIDLEGVGQLKNLTTFYAQQNQLGRVEGFVDVDKNKEYTEGVDTINDESGNGKRDTDPLVELQSLPRLVNLYLYDNMLTSTTLIKNLPNLKILLLAGNRLEDITNLGEFKSLIRLTLSDNRITNIDGLEGLTKLEHLYLEENQVSDIRALRRLNALLELRLQRNQLVSIKAMRELKELRVVSLSGNFIHDPTPVLDLPQLKRLSLSSNCIARNDQTLEEKFSLMRSKGISVSQGTQRKRIVEIEQLIESLIGNPSSNKELGIFLRTKNRYDRLIDLAEDRSVSDNAKKLAYRNWDALLRLGKIGDVSHSFPKN